MPPLIATAACGRLRLPVRDRTSLESILDRADHPQEVPDQLDKLFYSELDDALVGVTENRLPQGFVPDQPDESEQNYRPTKKKRESG